MAQTQAGTESTHASYQSTVNWQRHGTFRSLREGPNSLKASAQQMFTFSSTGHWGLRPWSGAELYLNAELAAGEPFSDGLVGLGGFTNGEITRSAGRTPKPYLQRLFLRQTWNRGGATQALESDFNQMAGSVDRRRIVLTVGNFSILDVFDDNTYAKDPRTQFMNWGAWTHAAWDYAADARGFGWGLSIELHHDDWALRLARMTGPREPNGLQVDFDLLRHFGDQIEIARQHQVAGQPGAIRLLAYRNRAVLATFEDATRLLLADANTDRRAIFAARTGTQTKTGWGLNLEQALGKDLGIFLRGMRSDGRSETYAFTEVDRSLALGVAIQGAVWDRAGDSIGLAWLRHELSAQRRRYLEAGGISFFIGDGSLRYRPENIIEGFYSLAITRRSWATLGLQRIRNPAYNADRGPLTVTAIRFHAQF